MTDSSISKRLEALDATLSANGEKLMGAVNQAFGVWGDGPAFLEGIAVALAGKDLQHPVGPALERIADALERLAAGGGAA